jgi:hypothetical protein
LNFTRPQLRQINMGQIRDGFARGAHRLPKDKQHKRNAEGADY